MDAKNRQILNEIMAANNYTATINDLIGFNLKSYLITGEFASGSFGQVFEGHQVES